MSVPLYAPGQVRAMDARAVARGVTTLELMERAAGHLARGVLRAAGRAYGLRVAVLCGKGNNGGDGLAAARRLRAWGAAPVVHVTAGPEALSPDARVQWERWRASSGRVADSAADALAGADVAVDCLLGTGARGTPREPERTVIGALDDFDGPVVACDVPSGVDAATGRVEGVAVRATATVTLGAHKPGLWLWPGRGHAGEITLGDIGVIDDAEPPAAWLLTGRGVADELGPLDPAAHKRRRGVVTLVAGSPGMAGAAVLAARGALAAGAGLVTVATGAAEQAVVATRVPEALTVALPDDDPDAAFERIAASAGHSDAVAIGPGLGTAPATVTLVRRLVRELDLPVVLDADGLNAFADAPAALAEHAGPLLVLTPHAGELARLAPGPDLWDRRVERLPALAARWRAVLVAKGPGSLVCAPDGRVWVNPTATPALATGGTGDVLTGVLAALVAGRPRAERVAAGVWLHGAAGEEAAARSHPRSVTALDVAAALPHALRRSEEAP